MEMDSRMNGHGGHGCPPPHKSRGAHCPGSSFWMQDSMKLLYELDIKKGSVLVDLGCGAGDYSLFMSDIVGQNGCIYAVDKPDVIVRLSERIAAENCRNIWPVRCDMVEDGLPIEGGQVDVCFVFTVLHHLAISDNAKDVLSEAYRVLKPDGRLFVLECKKEPSDYGPPLHRRLSEEEVEAMAAQPGFVKTGMKDLGYNYLLEFIRG